MIMCGIKAPVDAKFYRLNVRLRRAQRSVLLPTLGRFKTLLNAAPRAASKNV